jgi:bifunctional DNA-binding transcriptional regulator/antitoxin component of YhaV-PrlF toxin-antitoxin module
VILPKAIRDRRRWPPGAALIVEETAEGVLLEATPAFASTTPEAVFGSLRSTGAAAAHLPLAQTRQA